MPKESEAWKNGGEARGQALPLDEVGRLVELLSESGIGEIRVRQGELEIVVKAKVKKTSKKVARPLSETRVAAEPIAPETLDARVEDEVAGRNGLHAVRSPLVGTFYRAPAPGEEAYVEVGDRVKVGQTLCIVEAMKLMNEIPSDVSGEIVEVLSEDAGGVEYDQPLFRIRPEA